MSWHDPVPVFALLTLLSTVWLAYVCKYRRAEPGELHIFLSCMCFGGCCGSLAGSIVLAVWS